MNPDKFIDKLLKDIKKYTEVEREQDLHYIRLCLKWTYYKGRTEIADTYMKMFRKKHGTK